MNRCAHCFTQQDCSGVALYVISQPHFVKIGVSHDPMRRMNEIQAHNPIRLALRFECWYTCITDARRAERNVHKHLQRLHVRGEWFKYKRMDRLVNEIITILESWPFCPIPQALEVLS